MARPVMFSATARLMRSHAHVNEPLGFGGDSPGGRKRLGCECRHDRLAEERVLLTVAGAQFKAGRRAIKGADKGRLLAPTMTQYCRTSSKTGAGSWRWSKPRKAMLGAL